MRSCFTRIEIVIAFGTMSEESPDSTAPETDYSRQLGVIEALTLVTKQCPSGPVRASAEQALANLNSEASGGLRNQVYFVLTAMKGWRGDRASQIHHSLTAYLESASTE